MGCDSTCWIILIFEFEMGERFKRHAPLSSGGDESGCRHLRMLVLILNEDIFFECCLKYFSSLDCLESEGKQGARE